MSKLMPDFNEDDSEITFGRDGIQRFRRPASPGFVLCQRSSVGRAQPFRSSPSLPAGADSAHPPPCYRTLGCVTAWEAHQLHTVDLSLSGDAPEEMARGAVRLQPRARRARLQGDRAAVGKRRRREPARRARAGAPAGARSAGSSATGSVLRVCRSAAVWPKLRRAPPRDRKLCGALSAFSHPSLCIDLYHLTGLSSILAR